VRGGSFARPRFWNPGKDGFSVKKFIAMLLMGAVLATSLGSIGCGDDKGKKTEKETKTKTTTEETKKTP
jgi:hypothetical protein